jgi:hypothetical protein
MWHAWEMWDIGISKHHAFIKSTLISKIWHKQYIKAPQGPFIHNFESLSYRKYGYIHHGYLTFLISFVFPLVTQQWFISILEAMPLIGEAVVSGGLPSWQIATVRQVEWDVTKHTLDFISRCAHTYKRIDIWTNTPVHVMYHLRNRC